MSKLDELVDLIVENAAGSPEEWRVNDFQADHIPSGVSIWLANSYFGVAIQARGINKIGGVTLWSSFFGWATPWRRRLFNAFKDRRPSKNRRPGYHPDPVTAVHHRFSGDPS